MMINVCCVWTGKKYSWDYVDRLLSMVCRHLHQDFRFIVFTDNIEFIKQAKIGDFLQTPGREWGLGRCCKLESKDVTQYGLSGWWAKMLLFKYNHERFDAPMLYLDLDTVIVDSLDSLVNLNTQFAVCRNFTKASGHPRWPCNYGSCVMYLAEGFGSHIDYWFHHMPEQLMDKAGRYGDQWVIEDLWPDADFLQDLLPPGYIVGRREFSKTIPPGAAVMVFAGNTKPHTHQKQYPWIAEHWK